MTRSRRSTAPALPLSAPRVPKYRLHKSSGQAMVQHRGRRYYLGVYGTDDSRERYARFVGELLASPTADVRQPATTSAAQGDRLTIVELCAAYVKHAEGYYQRGGVPTRSLDNIKLALATLNGLYGRTDAADFGPKAFKAIRATLIRGRKSRSYINKLMGEIRRVFKWGTSEELLPPGVYHALAVIEGLKQGRSQGPRAARG